MYPEITRDEVFRIETPRLWLRWPSFHDADKIAAVLTQGCIDARSIVAKANVTAVNGLIRAWRAEMEAGTALHFVLALKTGARQPVGIIHTGTDRTCIAESHHGLGEEAAQALAAMTALLGVRLPLRRTPPMAQQRIPAGAGALANCCMQA